MEGSVGGTSSFSSGARFSAATSAANLSRTARNRGADALRGSRDVDKATLAAAIVGDDSDAWRDDFQVNGPVVMRPAREHCLRLAKDKIEQVVIVGIEADEMSRRTIALISSRCVSRPGMPSPSS